MGDTPYETAARCYAEGGWSPIALPPKAKYPPPKGYTGYSGRWVGVEDVERLEETWGAQGLENVALRLPDGVVGIDVDDYASEHGVKHGVSALAQMEQRLGPLPPTWRSTSRGEGGSGIALYRTPPGIWWHDVEASSIDLIHMGHRYVVAAPSIHPKTGNRYWWYSPEGVVTVAMHAPKVEDLAWLPEAWIMELQRGWLRDRSVGGEIGRGAGAQAEQWLQMWGGGSAGTGAGAERSGVGACREMAGFGANGRAKIGAPGASRHDVARNLVLKALHLGAEGHHGLGETLDGLREAMETATAGDRAAGALEAEWERFLRGGVERVVGALGADAVLGSGECDPCNPAVEFEVEPAPSGGVGGVGGVSSIWTAHPILTHIRTVAWNRGLPAPSVLVGVLAELALHIGPHVVLPPASATIAPLNCGFALLGDSGAAKTSSARVGAEILGLSHQVEWHGGRGSGEGLIDAFYRLIPKDPLKPDGPQIRALPPIEQRRFLMTIDEAEELARVKDASTLPAYLRSGISGADLSNTNTKSGGNDRHVPRLTYRLVCVIGVHPDQADVLLGDVGNGFPQRFCWVSSADPDMPTVWAERPELPGGSVRWEGWQMPEWPEDPVTGFHVVEYPDGVEREVWEYNAHQMKNGKDALEAHIMLARLKIGVLLSALMGEGRLTPLGWELAGELARGSLDAQHAALDRMDQNQRKAERARVQRSAEVLGEVEDDRLGRCVEAVVRKLMRAEGEWCSWRECRPAGKVRAGLDASEAQNELMGVDGVETRERGGRGGGWEFRWAGLGR